ncbi:MAG TPA: RNA polymerase subunit sigma, partial [Chloroflexi bacterium]|nr:RNA polymerase subunit sigma [Chloroflexota bacterium]
MVKADETTFESFSEDELRTIKELVQLGEQQGFVTYEDILAQFPESEASIPVIERVYDALMVAGVELIDEEEITAKEADLPSNHSPQEEEENGSAEVSAIDAIDTGDTVGLYLSQVGRVPLLTRDEEVDLAKRIERGRNARRELASQTVSAVRGANLKDWIEDGMAAREHLIIA